MKQVMNQLAPVGICLLLASTACTGAAQAGQAEQTERDWAISAYVGMASFEEEEKPDPFQPIMRNMHSEDAYKIGVMLSKYYNNDLSINLGIEFTESTEAHSDDQQVGEHSQIPVSLGVNYHFDTTVLDPYIGAGIGYAFNDHSEHEFITNQGISTDIDHSIFYFFTAGVEYPLNEKMALFAAGQYTISDIEGTANIPGVGQIEDERTMDRYEFNLGVKYFF